MILRCVFGDEQGIIYAITQNNDLLFYRDEARNGNGVWAFGGVGQRIGQGWGSFQQVFSGRGGIIYAIGNTGEFFIYRDDAQNGQSGWAFGGGKQIGQGWNVIGPDVRQKVRWGVCLATFTGAAAPVNFSAAWLDKAFADPDGIASYFWQMSGERQALEWQTFGPLELMSLAQKQVSDAKGTTITDFRAAALAQKLPINNFDHFMWIY